MRPQTVREIGVPEDAGRQMARWCLRENWTQKDLAAELKVHYTTLCTWTAGERRPGTANWEKFLALKARYAHATEEENRKMGHWQPGKMLEAVVAAVQALGADPGPWHIDPDGSEWEVTNRETGTTITPTWAEAPCLPGVPTRSLPYYRVFYWENTLGTRDDPPDHLDKTHWEGSSPWEAAKRAALHPYEERVDTTLEALSYRWMPEGE